MPRARIVIIERKPPRSFSEKLEERSRALLADTPRNADSTGIGRILDNELALTLDQLTGIRKLHASLDRRLLLLECYVDTEIIQSSPRPPFYYDRYWHERQMLRRRLLHIEDERRKLALKREDSMRPLQDKLLTLLHRRALLRGDTSFKAAGGT